MKANGAPDKLYLLPNGLISYCRNTDEDAEYTRTDAFIEKACVWLKEHAYFYVNDFTGSLNENVLIEDFRNYMKGE